MSSAIFFLTIISVCTLIYGDPDATTPAENSTDGGPGWRYLGCYRYWPLEVRTVQTELQYDRFHQAWKDQDRHWDRSCMESCQQQDLPYASIAHYWPNRRLWMECWCGTRAPPTSGTHARCADTRDCFRQLCVTHHHSFYGVNTSRVFWFTDHESNATVEEVTSESSAEVNQAKVGQISRDLLTTADWLITPRTLAASEAGLSSGAIAGLVVAVLIPIVIAVMILLLAACFYKRSLRQRVKNPTANYGNPLYAHVTCHTPEVSGGDDSQTYESLPANSEMTVSTDISAHVHQSHPEKSAEIFKTKTSGDSKVPEVPVRRDMRSYHPRIIANQPDPAGAEHCGEFDGPVDPDDVNHVYEKDVKVEFTYIQCNHEI